MLNHQQPEGRRRQAGPRGAPAQSELPRVRTALRRRRSAGALGTGDGQGAGRGLQSFTAEGRRDLLEIAEARHGRKSILIASQIPVERWPEVIGDLPRDPTLHRSAVQGVRLDPRRNHSGTRPIRPPHQTRSVEEGHPDPKRLAANFQSVTSSPPSPRDRTRAFRPWSRLDIRHRLPAVTMACPAIEKIGIRFDD